MICKHGSSDRQVGESDRYRSAMEYALGVPFVDGNLLTTLQNGDQIFPAMLAAIENASVRLDFVTYVYWTGEIAERFANALAAAAARGVQVRVLLDAFGCKSMRDRDIDCLNASAAQVRWFRPLSFVQFWRNDNRTHRKILVVDDEIAFTGGVGISEEWSGNARGPKEWRDTQLRIEGPAVYGLRSAFMDNWNEAGDWVWDAPLNNERGVRGSTPVQVIRSDSTIGHTHMASVLRSLVAVARNRIRIVSAYFVPDSAMLQQLSEVIQRGIEVEILVPGSPTDSRLSQLAGNECIEQLLHAGATIWHYERTMLHAKIVIVDENVCCVGSPNVNHRSMGKDEECCVVALSESLAIELNGQFDLDCSTAKQLSYQTWRNRHWLVRAQERVARIVVKEL